MTETRYGWAVRRYQGYTTHMHRVDVEWDDGESSQEWIALPSTPATASAIMNSISDGVYDHIRLTRKTVINGEVTTGSVSTDVEKPRLRVVRYDDDPFVHAEDSVRTLLTTKRGLLMWLGAICIRARDELNADPVSFYSLRMTITANRASLHFDKSKYLSSGFADVLSDRVCELSNGKLSGVRLNTSYIDRTSACAEIDPVIADLPVIKQTSNVGKSLRAVLSLMLAYGEISVGEVKEALEHLPYVRFTDGDNCALFVPARGFNEIFWLRRELDDAIELPSGRTLRKGVFRYRIAPGVLETLEKWGWDPIRPNYHWRKR